MKPEQISPETLKTSFITPEKCVFSRNDNGFTGAVINGKEHKRVLLKRALPFEAPDDYICVTDADSKELGIIEHLEAFNEEQREIIRHELTLRYFMPVISDILSIKEKMGHFYFDAVANGQKRTFTVKDLSKNVRMHGNNVDITDIDGNRYRITDLKAISPKSRRKLEPYIF